MNKTITDVSISIPTLNEIISVLTFQAGFNTVLVVFGTTLLGLAAGIVGTFALLRKRALVSDALAHATLPGLGVAFLISTSLGLSSRSLPFLLLGATVSGVAGVLTIHLLARYTRLGEDTAIGAVLSVFFGLGIVLLSIIQASGTGRGGGLQHFIYGQTAAMNSFDATLMAVVAALAILTAVIFLKEFRLVCFDPEFARQDGWPVGFIDLLLMSLIVIVTVVGLQSVGLILSVALIIVPAASARFWTERLSVMVVISAILGALSGYFGASASALLERLPAGSVIVITAGVLFCISLIFAPCRGVLASAFRLVKLRLRIASEHLLRQAYEAFERTSAQYLKLSSLRSHRERPALYRWLIPYWLESKGLVTRSKDAVTLSPQGLEEALKVTRRHRLWEEYLISYAHLEKSHVDWSADEVEHFLSSDIVEKLESDLKAKGRLPSGAQKLKSVHPIES